MSYRKNIQAVALAGLLGLPSIMVSAAEEPVWQGFRGQDPSASLPETFGLTRIWQRELGAGYSSLAVADGKLLTLFTSGENDVLAAFDKDTGNEIWRLKLADKYAGHDGSDDGPLASPTVDGDRVYALGPKGQLVAASLKDGRELWRVQLDDSNSTVPFYGYTASPLVVDDLVVVLAGGKGRTVTAHHKADGRLAWQVGDDSVTYQTPIVAELGGSRQIVAVSDFEVRGLDLKGRELWSFRHTEGTQGESSAHPTAIDSERLMINLSSGSSMLRVKQVGGQWQVEEQWRSRPFGNALVVPVLHDGAIFGFTGRILTAVDPDTGDFLWRSRNTQGVNLSLVDGHLAVVTFDGRLSVSKAGTDAYAEVARAEVFERGDYADPAFSDGVFYIRNQTHMAALQADPKADSGVGGDPADKDPHRYLGSFGNWIKALEAKPEGVRQAAVDSYFADIEQTPILEEDGSAHIIYRGEADEVVIQGTIFGWTGDEVVLHQIAGTSLHYRSLKLDPAGSYDYLMTIGFEAAGPDPMNPLQEDAGFVVRSELRMPNFRANPHSVEPGENVQRGTLDQFRFHSEILGNSREINVWIPAGYSADNTYPLLVVNHGLNAVRSGLMQNTLDNIAGQSVRPLVVAFVPRLQGSEYNGDTAPDHARFLVEELVPHLERHYRTGDERAIMGPASAAIISLRTAMEHPGVFQRVAMQSFYLQDNYRDAYWQLLEESDAKPRVWVETGPNDYVIPNAGIDARKSSEELVERLRSKGLDVDFHPVHGVAGWVGWRAQFDLILEDLFPLEEGS